MSTRSNLVVEMKKWRNLFSHPAAKTHRCFCDGDGCGKVAVSGVRYLCFVCPDFDLCEACLPCDKHFRDAGHAMLRITSPSDRSWKLFYAWARMSQEKVQDALFDELCHDYVGGENCTDEQYRGFLRGDVDLPEEVVKGIHAKWYEFDALVDAIVKSAYRCNKCGEIIDDIRFTCITCVGYDLCERCEKTSQPGRHDHAMIRCYIKGENYFWLPGWFLANTMVPVYKNKEQQQEQQQQQQTHDGRASGSDTSHGTPSSLVSECQQLYLMEESKRKHRQRQKQSRRGDSDADTIISQLFLTSMMGFSNNSTLF